MKFGWLSSSRGFVSLGTAAALVALSVGVLLGNDPTRSLFDLGDGLAWLGSSEKGELLLADGASGEGVGINSSLVDAGSSLTIVHEDGVAYVTVDGERLYRLDPSETAASTQLESGERIVRGGQRAYLVNERKGTVRAVDPSTLEDDGRAFEYGTGVRAEADADGRLVVAEVATGKVHVVEGTTSNSPTSVGDGPVQMVGAGNVPTVVDVAGGSAYAFNEGKPTRIRLNLRSGRHLVPRTAEVETVGLLKPSTSEGRLTLIDVATGDARAVSVRSDVKDVDPPLIAKRAVYLVDRGAGRVLVVDPASGDIRQEQSISSVGRGDGLEIFVKDGYLWVNNPDGDKAAVVASDGTVKQISKYETEGLPEIGGDEPDSADAPPVAAPVPGNAGQPSPATGQPGANGPAAQSGNAGGSGAQGGVQGETPPPVAGAPGAPRSFTATAGNGSVTLSWLPPSSDGGSRITHYLVSCRPGCGTDVRLDGGSAGTHLVDRLRNGEDYTFDIRAVNQAGLEGPPVSAGPVSPTAEVPSAPANVDVVANGNGTVTISWDEVDPEGLRLDGFVVSGVRDGTAVPIADVAASTRNVTTAEDFLTYDDDDVPEWRFVVTTRAIVSGSEVMSEPSTESNAVDPYNSPQLDGSVSIIPGDRRLDITWPAAVPRGRPLQYEVSCRGCQTQTTVGLAASITNLTNGDAYDVTVTARSDGGEDAIAGSGTPGAPPQVSASGARGSDAFTQLVFTVNVTDWGGSPGTCTFGGSVSTCSGRVTISGLTQNQTLRREFCATNGQGIPDCETAEGTTAAASPPGISNLRVVPRGGGRASMSWNLSWQAGTDAIMCEFIVDGTRRLGPVQCGNPSSAQLSAIAAGSRRFTARATNRFGQRSELSVMATVS